ncbi:FAD-binding oxidoreductase [Pseudonocardia ailaonensis]|uniref:FAD-binding oxidoreductase n=1 Tax=Pseudonocardia ailaonensis TaxID=367279 RepID=UPI003CD06678
MSGTVSGSTRTAAGPGEAVSGPRRAHDATVDALVRAYRAVPAGTRVRLGKRTSNLFRFGATTGTAVHLDTSGLAGVIEVDREARTADVQGMCTYEDLVAATLPHGLMPLVVPQLKTITLGGAVTGLGIESTSFRHGLPHESVVEMDVLTPAGELVTARPDGDSADLFHAFANSYGTLGYALRLRIELQPVKPYVKLTHHRYRTAEEATAAIAEFSASGIDFLDGTVYSATEHYVSVGEFVDAPTPGARVSDYTGMAVFWKSLATRPVDHLTVHDYLWRWDTDWFWCSRAFGVQVPWVRRLWPARFRRSDVYRRLVALDQRYQASNRIRRRLGHPEEEMVIQDVEIPTANLPEFLAEFHAHVGISPVWLCPLQLRGERTWPLYPMKPHTPYVNVGFWSSVPITGGATEEERADPTIRTKHNRFVEDLVARLDGHKSLYSTVHYGEAEFWERYNGTAYRAVKDRYDPLGRVPDLYTKVGGAA